MGKGNSKTKEHFFSDTFESQWATGLLCISINIRNIGGCIISREKTQAEIEQSTHCEAR